MTRLLPANKKTNERQGRVGETFMTERLPKIGPLPREQWTDAAREVFAYWEGEAARADGSRSNTMMTLAQHPPLALASLDFGKYFMLHSTLDARTLKLIILRVAHRYQSHYQWAHNALGARQVGVSEAEIEAVRAGPGSPVWNADDRLLLATVDQVCDGGRIDDATWAKLQAAKSIPQIMDIVQAIGYFTSVAWSLVAMGVQVEPDFAEFSQNRAKG